MNTQTDKSNGAVPGIVFAVSNDGGKTGVAWRDNVHDALAYLDLQNVNGGNYAVVAVRRDTSPEASKWRIENDNDTGPDDGGFWEWWMVTDGNRYFECRDEDDAKWLLGILAPKTGVEA